MTLKNFKLFLSGVAMLATAGSAFAIPAKPEWRTVKQPDGSEIVVRTFGDEKFHYTLTSDNHLVVAGRDGFFRYATVNDRGEMVSTDFVASKAEKLSAEASAFLSEQSPVSEMIINAVQNRSQSNMFRSPSRVPSNMQTDNFPVTGEQPVLVVLVEYKDVKFNIPNPQDYFHRLLNEEGFSDDGGTGSARDYFLESSSGQFSPRFDVYRPITLANNMEYYGGNNYYGNDNHPEEMAIEACQALDDEVDFSQYDRDNDGYIDNVFVIYAGYGEADTSSMPNTVWPHAFWIYKGAGKRVMLDGKLLDHYACSNEINADSKPGGISTVCHEFSHVMGLPDLYTTNDALYHTPLEWSILDAGCYNNDGRTPPAYSAFERMSLGWLKPVEITKATEVMIPEISSNVAFMIPTSNENEFFLFENRQKYGWDSYLPGHGMLIWRINYNKTIWESNSVNNSQMQRVDLIEAGGAKSSMGYPVSSSSDSWPGLQRRTSFTGTTSPAFKTSSGTVVDFPITSITETNGIIKFSVKEGTSRIASTAVPVLEQVSGRAARISWTAVDGATDYYFTAAAENVYLPLFNHVSTNGATSFTLSDLEPETTYHITVMTVGNSCVADESPELIFTTEAPLFEESKVKTSAPTDITADSFTANWDALNNAQSYHLTVKRLEPSTAFAITTGYDDSTLPDGWTTTASGKYSGIPGSFGVASPALRLNTIGEYIETPVMPGDITYVSFWLRGRTQNSTLNFITIYGLTASEAWEKIEDITIAATARVVEKAINPGYRALKLEYTGDMTGSNPIGIDDITIKGGKQAETATLFTDLNVGDVTSYRVTGLDNSYQYIFSVRAHDGDNFSLYSDEVPVILSEGQAGIGSIDADSDIRISGGNRITIEGTDANAMVYNLQGTPVYSGPRRSIELPAGLYIVRVASVTTKVTVR